MGREGRNFILLAVSLSCTYCLTFHVTAGGAWSIPENQITIISVNGFDHAGERPLMANRELMIQRLWLAAAN